MPGIIPRMSFFAFGMAVIDFGMAVFAFLEDGSFNILKSCGFLFFRVNRLRVIL